MDLQPDQDNSPLATFRHSDKVKIARFLHDEWSLWMATLIKHSEPQKDGSLIVPAGLAKEWDKLSGQGLGALEECMRNMYLARAERLLKRLEEGISVGKVVEGDCIPIDGLYRKGY